MEDYGERTFGLNYETFDELKLLGVQNRLVVAWEDCPFQEYLHTLEVVEQGSM